METSEVEMLARERADRVALEAARRADLDKSPGETYKETYERVYDFLISKHEAK